MKIKIAIVQEAPIFLNLDSSIELACALINESSAKGADLIVFPETWLPGYPVWLDSAPNSAMWNNKPAMDLYKVLFRNSLSIGSKEYLKLFNTAVEAGIILVIGANEKEGKTIYNSVISVNGTSKEAICRRKLVPTYSEKLVWGRGDGSGINILSSKFGNIGAMICWEHWMPLLRAAMHSLNETIHIAQWPTVHEKHQIASRHYAFEGRTVVIASGCIMSKKKLIEGYNSLQQTNNEALSLLESIEEEAILLGGGSSIISPTGDYILEPQFEKSGIIYCDTDIDFEGSFMTLDVDGHYSRPDIFELRINTSKQNNITRINDKDNL